MRMQERFIVPGLGVIVLLSLIALGARNVSLIYLLVMGVLGIAAIGTYFLPHAVQIETRIAIAALGLLTMFTYFSSLGFWLALLAFGAMGALQIRYRDELQTPLHTVAWLNEALARRGAGGAETAQADDGDGAGGTTLPIPLPAELQGRLRIDVAGIGASVLGGLVLLSLLLPWMIVVISVDSESAATAFTFLTAAQGIQGDTGDATVVILFWALVALGVLSMASVVLPRLAVIIKGVAGMSLTLLSFIYIYSKFSEGAGVSDDFGISVSVFPFLGFLMTGGSFLLITVLQLIPRANKPRG